MAIHACGDSHVRCLRLAVDNIVEFGGMPFHAIGQFGIPNTLNVCAGDIVIFCFGEVDIRAHLPKLAEQHGVSTPDMIARVIPRYVERIRVWCQERQAQGHIIAAPPQSTPTTLDAIFPTVDSLADRIERTRIVNELLAQICAPDIGLIDIWGPARMPDGSFDMSKSDGIVHYADSYRGVVADIVRAHLTPPT